MTTKVQSHQLPTLGYLCNGRLTLETGVPISTSDQADKTTLYFTPYMGDLIYIYDGTSWVLYSFTELSLNISGFTASKPYDIFIYDNAGTLTLEGVVWTSATARATALTTQNGICVLTGATNKRYLGTIYMDSASKCQDTEISRFVWNYYNRVQKTLIGTPTFDASHTYTTAAYRNWNNLTTIGIYRLEFIVGVSEDLVNATGWFANSAVNATCGIGINASSDIVGISGLSNTTNRISSVLAGYNYIQAVEYGIAGNTYLYLWLYGFILG